MFLDSCKSHYVIRISVVAKFMFGKTNFVYNNPLHIAAQQTPLFLFFWVVNHCLHLMLNIQSANRTINFKPKQLDNIG